MGRRSVFTLVALAALWFAGIAHAEGPAGGWRADFDDGTLGGAEEPLLAGKVPADNKVHPDILRDAKNVVKEVRETLGDHPMCPGGLPKAPDKKEEKRKTPASKECRIIVNWDEINMWSSHVKNQRHDRGLDAKETKAVLEEIVDEHARAKVDRIVHCVISIPWGGIYPWYEPFGECPRDWLSGLERFHEAGHDLVQTLLDRSRQNGMQFLAGLRMNDRHGGVVEQPFPKANPELMAKDFGAVDYKHEEVRQAVLAFTAEFLEKYDVDGIELDWMRWCKVFNNDEAVKNTPLLTDLMSHMREVVDQAARKRGRNGLLLGVRVPQTLDECQSLGFDVAAWIKEGYVDYVVPSDFFYTDFNTKVDEYVALAEGTDCKIYPAIHPILCIGNKNRLMNLANYRAAAHNFYARGAAGVSPYNYQYSWDKRRSAGYPGSGLMWPAALGYMRELRDPERVSRRDRHYLFYALWSRPSQTGFRHDERIVLDRAKPGAKGATRLRLCEDLSDPNLRAALQFKATGMREDETLEIALNGRPVPGKSVTRVIHADGQTKYEGRKLPAFFLHIVDFPRGAADPLIVSGDNTLTVHLKSDAPGEGTITIDEPEVYIHVSP